MTHQQTHDLTARPADARYKIMMILAFQFKSKKIEMISLLPAEYSDSNTRYDEY